MSVVQVSGKEIIFLSFEGAGLGLIVDNNELTLVDPKEDETPELQLNSFLGHLRQVVKDARHNIAKSAALRPLLTFMKTSSGEEGALPPEAIDTLLVQMGKSDVFGRKQITEAEEMILDLTDVMSKYNITIKSNIGGKKTTTSNMSSGDLKILFDKFGNNNNNND